MIVKNNEINRKILHLFFAILPIGLSFFPEKICIWIGIYSGIMMILGDIIFKKIAPLKIKKMFCRDSELASGKPTGQSWIGVSCIILVLFFNKNEYIPAMLATAFCDTLASLIGQKYGKHKIFGSKKSIEGFAGFLLGGIPIYLIVSLLGISINYQHFIIALFVSALCELIELIDDNLSVMLGFAIALSFLKV